MIIFSAKNINEQKTLSSNMRDYESFTCIVSSEPPPRSREYELCGHRVIEPQWDWEGPWEDACSQSGRIRVGLGRRRDASEMEQPPQRRLFDTRPIQLNLAQSVII